MSLLSSLSSDSADCWLRANRVGTASAFKRLALFPSRCSGRSWPTKSTWKEFSSKWAEHTLEADVRTKSTRPMRANHWRSKPFWFWPRGKRNQLRWWHSCFLLSFQQSGTQQLGIITQPNGRTLPGESDEKEELVSVPRTVAKIITTATVFLGSASAWHQWRQWPRIRTKVIRPIFRALFLPTSRRNRDVGISPLESAEKLLQF